MAEHICIAELRNLSYDPNYIYFVSFKAGWLQVFKAKRALGRTPNKKVEE